MGALKYHPSGKEKANLGRRTGRVKDTTKQARIVDHFKKDLETLDLIISDLPIWAGMT